MKKIFLLSFLLLFLAGGHVQAAGLVPCGGTGQEACSFCHIFTLIDNILDFVLIKVVPSVAVLMLVIGGIMFILALTGGAELLPGGGKGGPKTLNQAKKLITSVIIGLFIIFTAYLVVGIILQAIGLSDWTQEIYHNWWEKGFFEINC